MQTRKGKSGGAGPKPVPAPERAGAARQPEWIVIVVVACVAVAAAVVRFIAAQDEFWLDEILSLRLCAESAKSPFDVLTLHLDNNHYLVTLWMYLVGDRANWSIYRAPSIVAGVGTVLLAAVIARRWGSYATVAAAILTGSSYFLITYSSEARGYAPAGFFALTAFLGLDRYLTTRGAAASIAFGAASVLGFLSNLTFIEFYLGAIAWSLVSLFKSSSTPRQAVLRLFGCHAAPCCFLVALYLLDVRKMHYLGADPPPILNVIASTLALFMGIFAQPAAIVYLAALVGIVLAAAGIVALWREKSELAIFFAMTILIAPAILLAITRTPFFYERHFYVSFIFLQLLGSYLFGKASQQNVVVRGVAAIAIAAVVFGNIAAANNFLKIGRGHFREALQYVAAHTDGPDIYIQGEQELRDAAHLHFYSQFLSADGRVRYRNVVTNNHLVYQKSPSKMPPDSAPEVQDWVLIESQAQPFEPPPMVVGQGRQDEYVLEKVFRYAGMSGFHFAVYRHAAKRGASPQN